MNVHETIRAYIVDRVLFGDEAKLSEGVSFQRSGFLDSMGFLELITFVEDEFGIEIADNELVPDNFDTLRSVSDFVTRKLHQKAVP
jgi:acyl carrier protein